MSLVYSSLNPNFEVLSQTHPIQVGLSSNAPLTAGDYEVVFKVIDDADSTLVGYTEAQTITIEEAPNQPPIGTPDANPSYILTYVSGATETIGGTLWTAGDIREIWPGNTIQPQDDGERIDLTTTGLELGLYNYYITGVNEEWIRFQFKASTVTSPAGNYAFIDRKNGVVQSFGLNNYTSMTPDPSTWVLSNTITGDMFFPCTVVFDDGRIFSFKKGQNW